MDSRREDLEQRAQSYKMAKARHEANVRDLGADLARLAREIQIHDEAKTLLLEAAKFSREKTIGFVERIVSHALRGVFEDPSLAFVVQLEERRNILEADFLVRWTENGATLTENPADAKGGSLVDVITTALRIVLLYTTRPQRRQILLLDEPGRFLDAARRERYATWLRGISHELGIQVILITHAEEIEAAADRIVLLTPFPEGVKATSRDP